MPTHNNKETPEPERRREPPASGRSAQSRKPRAAGQSPGYRRSLPTSQIRVRTKRLDQIEPNKISLAFWLLARQIAEDGTGLNVTEEQVQRLAAEIDDDDDPGQAADKARGVLG